MNNSPAINIPTSGHYLIRCNQVFDAETARFSAKVIEVKGDKFHQIYEPADTVHDQSLTSLNLYNMTLMPLLCDTHIHLYMNPWPLEPDKRTAPGKQALSIEHQLAEERMRQALLTGVATLRDLGDPLGINIEAAKRAYNNSTLPHIICAGPAIHREGRYGRFLGLGFENKQTLMNIINHLCQYEQVDLIKLVLTGIVNFEKGVVPAEPQFSLDELKLAVATAHSQGRKVAAHCSGEAGLDLAIDAGIDFIEHGYFITRQQLEKMAEKQLCWTPTLSPLHIQWKFAQQCGWNDSIKQSLKKILDGHKKRIKEAFELGVPLLAGSDAGAQGVTHGGGLWLELNLLHEAGIPLLKCLQMATFDAHKSLASDNRAGNIAQGLASNYMVLDSSVENLLSACNNIKLVVHEGQIISKQALEIEDLVAL